MATLGLTTPNHSQGKSRCSRPSSKAPRVPHRRGDPNDNDDDVDEDEEDEDRSDGPAVGVQAGRKLANQSKLVAANLC
jgi:hypothetical protein